MLTSGNGFALPMPGLQLKAWALFRGATGTLVKGMNVTSIVRGSTGSYTLTFTAALAGTDYVTDQRNDGGSNLIYNGLASKAVGSCVVNCFQAGSFVDPALMFIAFYE